MNKQRVEMKNIMFMEKIIKSIRIIRRNNFVENMRIRMEIGIKKCGV